MAPTTDYQILVSDTHEDLVTQVKAAIAKGWQVYGGAFFAGHQLPFRRNAHFYQPMIKTPDLMQQMVTLLGQIATSTANIDVDADTLKANTGTTASNTGTTASNTTAIKNSVASIDSKVKAE